MDTRTGYIYEGNPDSIAALLRAQGDARTIDQIKADLTPVSKSEGEDTCPKCHGTGAVPRGLNSKRFKPCTCVQ